jgi:hypothetical protein
LLADENLGGRIAGKQRGWQSGTARFQTTIWRQPGPREFAVPNYMAQKLLQAYRDQFWNDELFTRSGQSHIMRPYCRGRILLFESMKGTEKVEAVILLDIDLMAALEDLQNASGFAYQTAMGVGMHVRDNRYRCHFGQATVPFGPLLYLRCMAVNLGW